MEVTSRTSEISTQNQSLVVKTTTVVTQTTNSTTANGEVETSQANETQQMNSELQLWSIQGDMILCRLNLSSDH